LLTALRATGDLVVAAALAFGAALAFTDDFLADAFFFAI
jgi:hypothetical protein